MRFLQLKMMVTIFRILVLAGLVSSCKDSPSTLFKQVAQDESHITFNNKITESDSINSIKTEFLYNGGGVAAGDFNRDGLQDLYFTAGMVSNKLYLNKGDLTFLDVTEEAGVTGNGSWCNGAAVIDINNDGWPDIYVSTTMKKNTAERRNLLYINQGLDKDARLHFKEMAGEYGLADTGYAVQAVFLDYDHDSDLDLYLAITKPTTRNINTFAGRPDSSHADYDKLYRNDWNESLQHPVFTDVSAGAGITGKGYALAVTVSDVNQDGWPDIYVTNDFISSDLLYINNQDGTFSNRIRDCLKHTSQNAMGNDVVDINNDGLPDIVAVDMNPEDNYRKQKNMASINYSKYRNMFDYGYSIQYVRNTLQINQGPSSMQKDSIAIPLFSDIAYYAGIAETDWSWTPSVADFDNDGRRDIIITNGYPKDVTDHDYISYRQDKGFIVPIPELLKQIPEVKIPNYAYHNKGNGQFENLTSAWGLHTPSYSTGAIYVDLDNDGDLDYIVNNINEPAFVYENTVNTPTKTNANYLRVQLKGDRNNLEGIGAKLMAWYNHELHVYEHYPWRGYLSTVDPVAHFGLNALTQVDSLEVQWPGGKSQRMRNVKANQLVIVDIKNAATGNPDASDGTNSLFVSANRQANLNFLHLEYDYIDFNVQKLLPHKLSEFGPSLAIGDVDGNGTEDLYVGGPKGISGSFLLQQPDGKFKGSPFQAVSDPYKKPWDEMGTLLFDADNDSDLDLYLCSGSNEFKQGDTAYLDRLFLNDGKGNFSQVNGAIPQLPVSKNVIKGADMDGDGDIDLFIGARQVPMEYPKPASGYIFRNDTKNGIIKFTDVTAEAAPALKDIGMISDAVWSDFDNDGQVDLVICGEFMPVFFLRNDHQHFSAINIESNNNTGLWNSLAAADIDNDGDMDYIAGNAGLNSFYKGSPEQPFQVYAADFDKNGSYDAIPFLYLKNSKGEREQFPSFTRDDMVKQLIRVKGEFPTYKDFATATLDKILTAEERRTALVRSANYFQSAVFENLGRGKFKMVPLPYQAQWSPIYGILADDFNNDGNPDLLLNGNDYGTEPATGQYDALYGLLLLGDGNGNFNPTSLLQSGILIPNNGKALVKLNLHNQYAVMASQNRGPLQLFALSSKSTLIPLATGETTVKVYLKNGRVRKEEFFFGSSFLSQSSRSVLMNGSTEKIEITNNKGLSRTIINH